MWSATTRNTRVVAINYTCNKALVALQKSRCGTGSLICEKIVKKEGIVKLEGTACFYPPPLHPLPPGEGYSFTSPLTGEVRWG